MNSKSTGLRINQTCDNLKLSPEQIFNRLSILDKERESVVLKLRFGFTDGNLWSLSEIAKLLNRTPERIRQIEAKSLEKIRKSYERE